MCTQLYTPNRHTRRDLIKRPNTNTNNNNTKKKKDADWYQTAAAPAVKTLEKSAQEAFNTVFLSLIADLDFLVTTCVVGGYKWHVIYLIDLWRIFFINKIF